MTSNLLPQHRQHPRRFQSNRYVYPVLSRRSRGVSVGVNLNPDRVCNFHCVYCQVDRRSQPDVRFVDTRRLLEELRWTLEFVQTGQLFECDPFRSVPVELHRLADVAFSGDGEPTTFTNFAEVVEDVGRVKDDLAGRETKLVLISNASTFHRPSVRRGLERLHEHNGQVWAKLDWGSEESFRRVARTKVPFSLVLQNITYAASRWPLVIQSLFFKTEGAEPPSSELDAYVSRLREITAAGGRIELVQLYTVARPPTEPYVEPVGRDFLEALAERVRAGTGLRVEVFS